MERILVIQTAFIGDLVLTTSFLRELRKLYPNSYIAVLVHLGTEDILNQNPHINEVIPLDKNKIKSSISKFYQFMLEIRSKKFTICFSCHFSYRSSLISFFSGAKKRVGYSNSGFGFLHNLSVFRPKFKIHEVDKLYYLLYQINDKQISYKRPELFLEKNQVLNIKLELEKCHLIPKKFIILAPSSVWKTKQMPKEKFFNLGKMISTRLNYKFVVVGSKKDFQLGEFICSDYGFNFCGKTNLIELSYLIKNSVCVVSNDSSPIHFASAHNIPTISIFGATVKDFGYTSLSEKNYLSEVKGLDCRPCGIHGGNKCYKKHFKCMNEQDLESIFFYIQKYIS